MLNLKRRIESTVLGESADSKALFSICSNSTAFYFNHTLICNHLKKHIPNVEFLNLTDDSCTLFTPTDIIEFDTNSANLKIVGSFDSNILAVKYSPDSELFVLVNASKTLLIMTSDFHVVYESALDSLDIQNKLSNLGWGKKSTQFHPEGKHAATAPEHASFISPNDDLQIQISWRGDGNYFCVCWIQDNCRLLSIYSRDGLLQNVSQHCPGLENQLAWRPNGNLIAATQLLNNNKQKLIFFEKNGLMHGEFNIDSGQVKGIYWSADSLLLALWMKKENAARSSVQFWSSLNYHWYLKQELSFESEFACMDFDKELPDLFHYVLQNGYYAKLTFTRLFDKCTLPDSDAVVAVIDSSILGSFRQSIIHAF
jgi:elongator complex protein 1